MNVKDLKEIAKKLRYDIMKEIDIKNVEIHLDLGSDAINVEKPLSSNIQSPANNQIGSSEIKFAWFEYHNLYFVIVWSFRLV